MKSMREMISLMEGVVAVPGVGANLSERANNTPLRDINDYRVRSKELQKYLMDPNTARDPALKASVMKSKNILDQQAREMGFISEELVSEKSTSEKQARFMAACAHGADYDSCPDDKVSKEFNKADAGTKQLSNAMKHVNESAFIPAEDEEKIIHLMRKYGLNREEAESTFYYPEPDDDPNELYGDLEESLSSYDENHIAQAVKHFLPQAKDMEELCTIVSSEAGYAYTPEFKALVQREANKYFGDERPEEPEEDYTDWSMRQGEMGLEENNMNGTLSPELASNMLKILDNWSYGTDDENVIGYLLNQFPDNYEEIEDFFNSNFDFSDSVKQLRSIAQQGSQESFMQEAHVDSCRQTNPAVARKACKMEEGVFDENFDSPDFPENENITLASKMYKDYTDSFVEPQEAFDLVIRHFDEMGLEAEELDEISDALMVQYGGPSDDEPSGPDDLSMDGDALASAGHGSDEDYGYGSESDFGSDYMEEDLQNGYHDRHCARGDDYFPNGADSPVVRKVGPSGARHGDNPEQKKMQIEEVHKELVYGYRQFLGEAFKKKSLTESAIVSDIEIQNESGDFDISEDTISYDGILDLSASGVGNDGQQHEVGYSVKISAAAEYTWESDDVATGWNYKTDSEVWSSKQYASMDNVIINNIELDPENIYIIDNEEISAEAFQQAIHPATLKQLLNPEVFSNLLHKSFQRQAEKLDPPTYEREYDPDDAPSARYDDSGY